MLPLSTQRLFFFLLSSSFSFSVLSPFFVCCLQGVDSPLNVSRAQTKHERSQLHERHRRDVVERRQNVNLYVRNLEDAIDDDVLRRAFSEHGTITSARVMRNDNGSSRGFGFVCFSEPNEATMAVTAMNGTVISPNICAGLSKPLYVALAQRKNDRQAGMQPMGMHMYNPMMGVPYGQSYYPYPMYAAAAYGASGGANGAGGSASNGAGGRWQQSMAMPYHYYQQQQQRAHQQQMQEWAELPEADRKQVSQKKRMMNKGGKGKKKEKPRLKGTMRTDGPVCGCD